VHVTRWDLLVWARAAAASTMALGVAWLVAAATDEGGVSWGARAGRTLPLTPVCAALGVWAALAPVRARGEARALAAIGRSPAQVSGAAIAGAASVAFVAAIAIGAVRGVDVTGFYPTVTHARAWEWHDPVFVDAARGLRVAPDGTPEHRAETAVAVTPEAVPRHGRIAAALAMAVAGIAVPMLVALTVVVGRAGARRDRADRYERAAFVVVSGCAVVASILCFQAAAARLLPAMTGVLPSAALLAFSVRRYISSENTPRNRARPS